MANSTSFDVNQYLSVETNPSKFENSPPYVVFRVNGRQSNFWINVGNAAWQEIKKILEDVMMRLLTTGDPTHWEISKTLKVVVGNSEYGMKMTLHNTDAFGHEKNISLGQKETERLIELKSAIDLGLRQASLRSSHVTPLMEDSAVSTRVTEAEKNHQDPQGCLESITLYRYKVSDPQGLHESLSELHFLTEERAIQEGLSHVSGRDDSFEIEAFEYEVTVQQEMVDVPNAFTLVCWVYEELIRKGIRKVLKKDKENLVWGEACAMYFHEVFQEIHVETLASALYNILMAFKLPVTNALMLAEAAHSFPLWLEMQMRSSPEETGTIPYAVYPVLKEILS